MALIRPSHAGDGGALWEFVANGLLLIPLSTNLVDEYNVIGLSDSNPLRIRRKCDGANNVALVVFFSGTSRELVLLLAILIIEMDDSVGGGDGKSLGVGRPIKSSNLLHAINGWLQILVVLDLHLNYNFRRKRSI
jgi:hypothetical protein